MFYRCDVVEDVVEELERWNAIKAKRNDFSDWQGKRNAISIFGFYQVKSS